MLKLSKKVEYALMALLHMDALESDDVASAKDMAAQHGIPADLLGKVLQALARDGLAESIHGARGGYRLMRPLDDLTLGDVIGAIEGPVSLVRCQDHPGQCDQYGACTIREPVLRIQRQLQGYLQAFKLGEFRNHRNRKFILQDAK